MLNALYDIGKLWLEKDNINKLEILLDSNKLTNTKRVLFVELNVLDNEVNYNGISLEEFKKDNNIIYLYKKGSPRGTNMSPSSLITDVEKTFNIKFIKWFKDNQKKDDMIKNVYNALLENADKIIEELKITFKNIESDNNQNSPRRSVPAAR